MGRRKIEIKAIKDDRNRSVTFLKRKGGLFKKAHELSVLCSVDVAVIIFGNNKKLYEYSSSDIGEILTRYQFYGGANEHKGPADFSGKGKMDDDDDDEDGSGPSHHGSVEPPQMMPPQFQNQVPFQHIQRHHTPSASPPIPNGVVFPHHPQQRQHTPQPHPGSRPNSRNAVRRPSSNLVPQQHPHPPPNGYAYMPQPAIYNPQNGQAPPPHPHGLPQHMQGPPMQGPPMQGPPMQGPPMQGPPMQGPPMQGPPMQGPPMPGPPQGGPPQGPPQHYANVQSWPNQAAALQQQQQQQQAQQHQQQQQQQAQQQMYAEEQRRSSMPPAPTFSHPQERPQSRPAPSPPLPQQQPIPRPSPPHETEEPQPQPPPQQQMLEPPKKRNSTKSRSIFTPIDESRSILSQHWASSTSNAESVRSELPTSNSRSQSLDTGSVKAEKPSPPLPTRSQTHNKTRASISSMPDGFTPPSRTNSAQLGGGKGLGRPVLKVQIPDEPSDAGSATADSLSSPRSSTNANGSQARRNGNSDSHSSGVVLPPPSPSASALLSAGGTSGPPNPFARPHPVSQNSQASNNSNMIDTPVSALPSRFMNNEFLPSPSSFYPEWNYTGRDSNTLPSPLNFATPVVGTGPSFLREDSNSRENGLGLNGKRKTPDLDGAESGDAKRLKQDN